MQCQHPKTDMATSEMIFHELAHYMGKEDMGLGEVLDVVIKWIEEANDKQQGVFGEVSNICWYSSKNSY